MSFGNGLSGTGFATAKARDFPTVRQFNVFLENRLGALLDLVRRVESSDNRIISMTVVDSADCAIIRLVLSDPDRASEIFVDAKVPFAESELLVVKLPDTKQPIAQICKALLSAEISIHYAYPLLVGPHGSRALALHVEDHELAMNTMSGLGFTIFGEKDFNEEV